MIIGFECKMGEDMTLSSLSFAYLEYIETGKIPVFTTKLGTKYCYLDEKTLEEIYNVYSNY